MKKKKLLIVGAGNVGERVAQVLRGQAQVFTTHRQRGSRAHPPRPAVAPQRRALVLNLDHPRGVQVLKKQHWDAVIHLAPPPAVGQGDPRTQRLLRALVGAARSQRAAAGPTNLPPRAVQRRFSFVYVSTSGVYGDCGGAWVSENRAPHPQSPRAQRRWHAERQIATTAKRQQWRATVLRAPGIYDAAHLPLQRLRLQLPAVCAEEDSYSNHIHADDLARCCVAALRSRRTFRVYNASDNSQLKMGDWFDQLADTFGLPRPPRLPRAQVQTQVSALLWSFMRESRRLNNQRLQRELKVTLRWPTVSEFLRQAPLRPVNEVNSN